MATVASEQRTPPALELRGVHKWFGDQHVLRGVDFAVPQGTTVVILGASGSGKSVLMKHMIGLLQPDEGEVLLEGEPFSGLDAQALNRQRRKFGMVFQGAALFDSMTVGENVAFPLREHTRLPEAELLEIVRSKLALVGLHGVEEKMPAELSGGMRKRVGLARAIVLEPKIVLYDEPTTGLDPLTTESVNEMILDARRELGVTSVVITHDVGSAMQVGDSIAFLHEGRIVAHAPATRFREIDEPNARRFLDSWFGRH